MAERMGLLALLAHSLLCSSGPFRFIVLLKILLIKINKKYRLTILIQKLNVAYTSFRPEPNHGFSSQPKLVKYLIFFILIYICLINGGEDGIRTHDTSYPSITS